MIKVYSRSPISHTFTILDKDGREKSYVIQGTNRHGVPDKDPHSLVYPAGCQEPKITELPKEVFEQIKENYKSHVKLFGGKDFYGVLQDAQIYIAENEKVAATISKESKPVLTEQHVATKTKDIQKLNPKDL